MKFPQSTSNWAVIGREGDPSKWMEVEASPQHPGFDFSLRPFAACSPRFSLSPFTVTVHPNKAPQNIYVVDMKAKLFVQSMTQSTCTKMNNNMNLFRFTEHFASLFEKFLVTVIDAFWEIPPSRLFFMSTCRQHHAADDQMSSRIFWKF